MEALIVGDKEERRNRTIRTYEDLLDYWTQPRMIGSSERLDQSAEFIQRQAENAKNKLAWLSLHNLDGSIRKVEFSKLRIMR